MIVTPRLDQVVLRPDELRTPGERFDGIERILVVRHDKLGDVVVTLPAVAALVRAYPEAHVTLAVDEAWVPLLQQVEGPAEVVALPRDAAGRGRFFAARADSLIVAISRDKDIAWAARFSRARHRLGTGRRFYSPLFTRRVDEPRREGGRHEVEYALSFAHRAGAEAGPARFGFREDGPLAPPDRREGIWIHPGSGNSCPRWELPNFVELIRRQAAAGRRVTVSTGPGEENLAKRLERDLEGLDVEFASPDLITLAGRLRGAELVVSNSTGPLHLAAALGTPTLAIHAPWATCGVARWGPYAANGWALTAECEEALGWDATARRKRSPEMMEALGVDAVEPVVEKLLAG